MDNNQFLTDWGLTLMVFLPLAGALVMLLIPKTEETLHKWLALGVSLAAAGVGAAVFADFDYGQTETLQFVVDKSWIDVINSRLCDRHRRPVDPAARADAAGGAAVHRLLVEPLPRAAQPQGVPHPAAGARTPACSAPSWRRT